MRTGRPSVTSKVDTERSARPHEQPWKERLANANRVGKLGPYISQFTRAFRVETNNAASAYYYGRELDRLAEHIPDKKPSEFTKMDLQDFYLYRSENLSPRTRARIISTLRRFFDWCMDMDLCDSNPARVLHRPKIPRTEPHFLPEDAVRTLLDLAPPHMRVFVGLAAYAGLRKGSIHALVWDDVDFRGMTLTIRRAKGIKHQTIPMAPALKDILIVWRDITRDNDCPYVFAHKWHGQWKPIYHSSSHKMFVKLTAEAGMPTVTAHDLRSHFATTLHQNGADIAVISRLLGHSDISTTMNHYAFTSDEQKEAAIMSLKY